MERENNPNPFQQSPTNKPARIPCENPRINGSKPFEILKISEECKKHIRRDGRK